jgi:hypothetical protein
MHWLQLVEEALLQAAHPVEHAKHDDVPPREKWPEVHWVQVFVENP